MSLATLLVLVNVIELFWILIEDASSYVFIVASIVKIIKYVIFLILLIRNKKSGRVSSGVTFAFVCLDMVSNCFTFASVVRFGDDRGQVLNSQLYCIYFAFVAGSFFMQFWADPPAKYTSIGLASHEESPEENSSVPNRLVFSWFMPILKKGFKTPLTINTLFNMNLVNKCASIVPSWDKNWKIYVDKNKKKKGNPKTSIFLPILRTYSLTYLRASSLALLYILLQQANPQILNLIIGFVGSDEEDWKGYLYTFLLVSINVSLTIIGNQFLADLWMIGLRVKTALTSAIYRKSMKLTSNEKTKLSVGETVNLMQIDTQKIQDLINNLNTAWASPLQIIFSLYFLWGILGIASLSGVAVMVIMAPLNAFLSKKMRMHQTDNMTKKDNRVKTMNEVLDGIKVLKLYAWEPSFMKLITDIRTDEVDSLRKLSMYRAVQVFVFWSTPFLIALASFATYIFSDPKNILDAQTAWVSMSYFNIMRGPLLSIPNMIVQFIQAQVSFSRVNNFLNAKEINIDSVGNNPERDSVVSLKEATMTWDTEASPTLNNLNMEVKKQQLVAIVGQVGSGKSSLLSAILGDMEKDDDKSSINVNGKISYVSQQAWMQNSSLKDNITFGKSFHKKMYDKVIEACALIPDFDVLPAGDSTEIGEKGINLSGGQKQRISVARSVYNNGDIYLFDDPLSAVDAHVGQHIFQKVIGPSGLLKNKTRILVTHGLKYLPLVDNIFVMKNGRISESGTYKELLNHGRDFSEVLLQYLQEHQETPLDNDTKKDMIEIKEALEKNLGGSKNLEKELRKTRSATSYPSNISGFTSDKLLLRKRRTFSVRSYEEEDGTIGKMVGQQHLQRQCSRTGTHIDHSIEENQVTAVKGNLIQEEKMETESVNSSVYMSYFKAVGLLNIVIVFCTALLVEIMNVGTNVFLTVWSNDPNSTIPSHRDFYLGAYGALGLGEALFTFINVFIVAIAGLNASSRLHNVMLKNILSCPMFFFDTTPKGRIVNRFSKDIDNVDWAIPSTISGIVSFGFSVISPIFIISYVNPIFIVIIIPFLVLYWFIQKVYVTSSRQLKRLESVARSPIYSHFSESLSGVSTIRAYKLQKAFSDENEIRIDKSQTCYYHSIIANRWLSIRLETIGYVILLIAALFAVLQRGSIDPGTVGFSLSYASQLSWTLNLVIQFTSQIENSMVSAERVIEYQTELPQEADWKSDRDPYDDWPQHGGIKYNGYQTRYREGQDLVLKGLDLDIKPGERVGIVGRTGAGKSSLTLSLFRILEASAGSITLDGIDISNIGLGTLRSRLTIIPQDPVLFSGTLRMNLDPFSTEASSSLWRVLELAHLKSFVSSRSEGLDYPVSEGGENLSVGQRQLVCLARALLRKTKILVLDEATAAVDMETDDLIQETIRKEFKDCTILTIAHRLNTIMDSHKVAVLADGRVLEFDSPVQLLKDKNSAFYKMANEAGVTDGT